MPSTARLQRQVPSALRSGTQHNTAQHHTRVTNSNRAVRRLAVLLFSSLLFQAHTQPHLLYLHLCLRLHRPLQCLHPLDRLRPRTLLPRRGRVDERSQIQLLLQWRRRRRSADEAGAGRAESGRRRDLQREDENMRSIHAKFFPFFFQRRERRRRRKKGHQAIRIFAHTNSSPDPHLHRPRRWLLRREHRYCADHRRRRRRRHSARAALDPAKDANRDG